MPSYRIFSTTTLKFVKFNLYFFEMKSKILSRNFINFSLRMIQRLFKTLKIKDTLTTKLMNLRIAHIFMFVSRHNNIDKNLSL